MIHDDIKNSNRQFAWEPRIENKAVLENLRRSKRSASRRRRSSGFIVLGMGGSHFAADFIKAWRPDFKVVVWSNYGLPPLPPKELQEHLVIASSYSGNTEETIDGFARALESKLNVAVVASGGKLVAMARTRRVPYVLVPSGFQPRMAAGYMLIATLALMREQRALHDLRKLARTVRPSRYEKKGKDLARKLEDVVPVVYASSRNYPIAYNWKIRLNETGKIPAFYNLLPEMNHNEMIGFDAGRAARALARRFYFIFLQDNDDHPRIIKRMKVMRDLFTKRGLHSEAIPLHGKSIWEKIFSSLVLADWTAYYIAQQHRADPEAVTLIEEFKKLIAEGTRKKHR